MENKSSHLSDILIAAGLIFISILIIDSFHKRKFKIGDISNSNNTGIRETVKIIEVQAFDDEPCIFPPGYIEHYPGEAEYVGELAEDDYTFSS